MKPKTVIPLILGVCVGGIAIKIVVNVVNNAKGATQANMTKCVVAKMDIGFAEEITPEKLMLKDWPRDSLPQEYFDNLEDLANRVTNMYLPKDVPVYPSMLAQPGTPPGIQTKIKPGYRAVSVGIDEVTGVAFQLKPGDWVDVLSLVRRRDRAGSAEFVSRIILQNVEIAAVGRALHTGKPGDAPKSVARSVTLLLKPGDVTKLHLAQSNRGKISLALRGNTDNSTSDMFASASNDQLLGVRRDEYQHAFELEPAGDDSASAAVKYDLQEPPSWIVTVISGNEMRFVEYKRLNGRWVLAKKPRAMLEHSASSNLKSPAGGDESNEKG